MRVPAVSPPPPEPALIDLLTRAQNSRMAENTSNRNECWMRLRWELHTSFALVLQQAVCLLLCVWGDGKGSEQKTNFPCPHLATVSSFCSKRNENSTQHHWILLQIHTNISLFHTSKKECMHACMQKAAQVDVPMRAHIHTHTPTGRVLNPLSFNPREQIRTVFCRLVWEMEREKRWKWRDWKNDGDRGKKQGTRVTQERVGRNGRLRGGTREMRAKDIDWKQAERIYKEYKPVYWSATNDFFFSLYMNPSIIIPLTVFIYKMSKTELLNLFTAKVFSNLMIIMLEMFNI